MLKFPTEELNIFTCSQNADTQCFLLGKRALTTSMELSGGFQFFFLWNGNFHCDHVFCFVFFYFYFFFLCIFLFHLLKNRFVWSNPQHNNFFGTPGRKVLGKVQDNTHSGKPCKTRVGTKLLGATTNEQNMLHIIHCARKERKGRSNRRTNTIKRNQKSWKHTIHVTITPQHTERNEQQPEKRPRNLNPERPRKNKT